MCVQEKRLHRVFGLRFGDQAYGFEELVAEMDSAFLCARIGLKENFSTPTTLAVG